MSKSTIITVVVLAVVGVGAYLFITDPFKRMAGGGNIESLAKAFMEDLQFKDFRQAGLYHHKLERDRVDLGRSLERLFLVKPEMLDIQEYRIVKSSIDSKGTRGRTLVRTKFKRLNIAKEPEEKDLILYWIKRQPDCPLGSKCSVDGKCVDEFGKVRFQTKDKKKREGRITEVQDSTNVEETDKPYTCSPNAKPKWFMNLDSTLKEKRYNK